MDQETEQNTSDDVLDATQHSSIELAWQKVLSDWGHEEGHRRFVLLCQAMGELSEAAKRYRQVTEEESERSPLAKQQLDKVLAAAIQALDASRSEIPAVSHSRVKVFAMGVFLMMIFFGFWALRKFV